MPETTDGIAHMADPVVTALATVDAVRGIVCFGSYALGTADAESDLDLYVICDPTVMPEATRHRLLARIPGGTALHLQYATPGWDNAWAPYVDRVTVEQIAFDIAYTTHDLAHPRRAPGAHGGRTHPARDALPTLHGAWVCLLTPFPCMIRRGWWRVSGHSCRPILLP